MEIIIKNEEASSEHGINILHVCDCVLKDKKDGDEVIFTGKGILVEHDGNRFISVHKVDGEDVEEMPDLPNDPSEMIGMNSDDALNDFMKNKGK